MRHGFTINWSTLSGTDKAVPSFGEREKNKRYLERPGAYAVLLDRQRKVAVIRVKRSYFLPGGGVDPGERAEAALVREAEEELGLEIIPVRLLGYADEYMFIPSETLHLKKTGTFFEASVVRDLGTAGEETFFG